MDELIFVKFRFTALTDFIVLTDFTAPIDFTDHIDKRLGHRFLQININSSL